MENENSPAHDLGHNAGVSAATWVFDGNTTLDTYRRVLRGIADIDPEIIDMFRVPNLSGEFDTDMTPAMLATQLGIAQDSDALDDACADYESGAVDGFWGELARIASYHLDKLD